MEKILNTISNPFDKENFKKLLDIYLKSCNPLEFYSNIVHYNPNSNMVGFFHDVHIDNPYIQQKNNSQWLSYNYFSEFFPSEHRIYINSSLSSTGVIVQKFIDECINNNIPFELKHIISPSNRSDNIVIGANSSVYKKQIDILKKIANENPELISDCGTPHILSANLDNWLGLADENIINRNISYSQSRLKLFDIAIKKFILKHPEENIDGLEKLQQIQNTLNESEELKLSERLEPITLPSNNSKLKTLLENEEYFSEFYEIFKNECSYHQIDQEMPAFYEGSIETLTQISTTSQELPDLNTKSPVYIINEYFSDDSNNLSTENELYLLKTIDEKFYKNSELLVFMFLELNTLINQDIINIKSTNFIDTLNNNIFELYSSGTIQKPNLYNFPSMRSLIVSEGENISNEKAKEIITERMQQLKDVFNKPIESIESKKKAIETLKKMLDNYKNRNPNFDLNITSVKPFEEKIKYLEFEIENDTLLRTTYQKIILALENKLFSNEELENIISNFQPKEEIDPFSDSEPILEEIPQATEKDISNFNESLSSYLNQENTYLFTAQDLGIASFDANSKLCSNVRIEINQLLQENRNLESETRND